MEDGERISYGSHDAEGDDFKWEEDLCRGHHRSATISKHTATIHGQEGSWAAGLRRFISRSRASH